MFHVARDLTATTAIVTVKIHWHASSQETYKARLSKQIIDTPFNRDKDFAEFTVCSWQWPPHKHKRIKIYRWGNKKFRCYLAG